MGQMSQLSCVFYVVNRFSALFRTRLPSYNRSSPVGKGFEPNNFEGMHLFQVMVFCMTLEYDGNHTQCTDQRDRVLSMMSLVHDVQDFAGFPDYAKPCEEVYEEAAR